MADFIGADIAPLVEAELDRRDPERIKVRPTTPPGFREAEEWHHRLFAERDLDVLTARDRQELG